jgi:HAD superfamily hydrolase (TIGR01509 family)
MALNAKAIKAVIFDYGSTLVEFGRAQVLLCDTALANALERHFGPPDLRKLKEVRDRDRMAPYRGSPPMFKENDLVAITTDLVRELYGVDPSPEQVADLLRVRYEIFVRAVQAPPYVHELLRRLRRKYRLGLLSNYPDGNAIRASLAQTGLARFFDAVIVSADIGLVKPHPVPFLTMIEALGVKGSQAVIVGDNWVADIQGAKQAGLQAVLCRQWATPEDMPRRPDDLEPDAIISHVTQIEPLLEA